jgi:hypothetical protein
MQNPESKSWIRENSLPFTNVPEEELCCVENCKSKKSIRNFSSLLGDWKVKGNCKHLKVCVHHYNHDLKFNPRNHVKKRKRKIPIKVLKFERRPKRRKLKIEINTEPEVDLCCIFECKRDASVRNFSSLKGKWSLKNGYQKKIKKKICNWHYIEDRKTFIEKKCPEPNKLSLLLWASLVV